MPYVAMVRVLNEGGLNAVANVTQRSFPSATRLVCLDRSREGLMAA